MFETIVFHKDGQVAELVFSRPEVGNGFNIPMCLEILEAIKIVSKDDSLRLLLIRAEGEIFSIGGDLKEMERAVIAKNLESLTDIAKLVQEIALALKGLPKPVIMEVDGAVAGAAFNLALAADFCLASKSSKFIQAFVNVGLAPDAGGLFFLTRALGLNRAMHLVMTGQPVSAEEGYQYGFVYKVCDSEQLPKVRKQLFKRLLRGSSNSYKAMKALAFEAFFQGWEIYARAELIWQEKLSLQEDFTEGVLAHAQRRLPKFSGKWQE